MRANTSRVSAELQTPKLNSAQCMQHLQGSRLLAPAVVPRVVTAGWIRWRRGAVLLAVAAAAVLAVAEVLLRAVVARSTVGGRWRRGARLLRRLLLLRRRCRAAV